MVDMQMGGVTKADFAKTVPKQPRPLIKRGLCVLPFARVPLARARANACFAAAQSPKITRYFQDAPHVRATFRSFNRRILATPKTSPGFAADGADGFFFPSTRNRNSKLLVWTDQLHCVGARRPVAFAFVRRSASFCGGFTPAFLVGA